MTNLTIRTLIDTQILTTINSLKHWDTQNNYRNCPKNGTIWFFNTAKGLKDTDGLENRVDSDQTAGAV